jgi:O-antigen ligase
MERWGWGRGLALAIGLAPVVLAAITWSPGAPEPWTIVARKYALPVLAMEVVAILAALATGLAETIRRIRLPRPAAIAAAVLGLVMAGTVPFAPVPHVAATHTALWVIHAFFALSVLHLAGRAFTVSALAWSYAIGFGLFCLLFFGLLAQVRDPGFHWNHYLPAFNHIRITGHYAAPAAALATGLMALARTPARWAAAFAVATLALALALWAGSRGALIGAGAGLVAGLLFAPPMRRPRAWGGFAAGLALAWLTMSALPAPGPNMGAERIVAATVRTADATTGRTGLWANVARAVAKRPVFGHGEGQMPYVAKFYTAFHPHNVVLQLLLAWGMVGLTCAVILAFYFAQASIRLVRSGADELLPPFLAMVALAVPALVDGSLFHLLPVSIFAACAGMVGARMPRPARAA